MSKIILTPEVLQETKSWLLGREEYISWDIEDMAEMRGLFIALIGREPDKTCWRNRKKIYENKAAHKVTHSDN